MKRKTFGGWGALLICSLFMVSCSNDIADAIDKAIDKELNKWTEKEKAQHLANLQNWNYASVTDEEAIEKVGLDNCFKVVAMTADDWNRVVDGESRTNAAVKDSIVQVRTLYYTYYPVSETNSKESYSIGIGLVLCHQNIAQDLLAIFKQLYMEKYSIEKLYPIDVFANEDAHEMLISANPSFCYFYLRDYPNAVDTLHTVGKAIDLNPLNPPQKGDKAVTLFKQHGFKWSGDATGGKKYHFEK